MPDAPTINPTENGPYRVTGCRDLRSYAGDKTFASDGTVKLCRCGGSKNKPYCDGTHRTNGFSSAKADDRVAGARESYVGQAVTVHDNRGICAHAARCTDTLKTVFKQKEEPWIDPDAEAVDKVVATVQQCPSGALSYSIDGQEHRDRDAEPRILIAPNGPYAVKGGATVEGVVWGEGASQEHFALCRCGHSKNKPFCSGAHWHHQFDENAPPRT